MSLHFAILYLLAFGYIVNTSLLHRLHKFAVHPIPIYRAQDIMVYIFSIPVQHTARKVDPIPQPLPGQGAAHGALLNHQLLPD